MNLLLTFENPHTCEAVAATIREAQHTGQKPEGPRAANLLQRLLTCVIYGPIKPEGQPGEIPPHTPNTPQTTQEIDTSRLWCHNCGKAVSNFTIPLNGIIRAWVECPECIAKGAK